MDIFVLDLFKGSQLSDVYAWCVFSAEKTVRKEEFSWWTTTPAVLSYAL